MAELTAFKGTPLTAEDPAARWAAVTPNDSADLALGFVVKALHNKGAGGVVTIQNAAGDEAEFYIETGGILPCFATRVMATDLGSGVSLIALG